MTKSIKRISNLADAGKIESTYLAIGIFDGVHRGHQQLLQNMVAAARTAGARPAVLTFFPHPKVVIQGHQGRFYLCTLEERAALITRQGLDLVVMQTFDESVRYTPATDFVDQLCRYLGLRQLWGGNFGLGYNREGDLPLLQKLGQEKGFSVHPYKAIVQWEDQRVSSSRVRKALVDGKMDDVSGCLGRPYRLSGTVIHGDGRGRQFGIPTANLDVWDELLLPANGVYAATAHVQGKQFAAAANIGIRPTVNGRSLNVEAHLLDFNEDIYGLDVTLEFISRIRDERKFPNIEALISQIKADIALVRKLMAPR